MRPGTGFVTGAGVLHNMLNKELSASSSKAQLAACAATRKAVEATMNRMLCYLYTLAEQVAPSSAMRSSSACNAGKLPAAEQLSAVFRRLLGDYAPGANGLYLLLAKKHWQFGSAEKAALSSSLFYLLGQCSIQRGTDQFADEAFAPPNAQLGWVLSAAQEASFGQKMKNAAVKICGSGPKQRASRFREQKRTLRLQYDSTASQRKTLRRGACMLAHTPSEQQTLRLL